MKRILFLTAILLMNMALTGQWVSDSSSPLLVAGGAGEQVLPKVGICSNGDIYISRFDNASGGYKVYLQRFDAAGNALWASPTTVEMTGSVSDTWLTDYDMTVDQEDNAIITFQDIRLGNANIYAYKVSPTGAQLWGANGLELSNTTDTNIPNYTPVVLNTQANDTYIAWQRQEGTYKPIWLQKVNAAGQIQWNYPPVSYATNGASNTWPQLLESNDGCILMKYFADSGPFWAPLRYIMVVKLAPDGGMVWFEPISEAGGISAWNQIIGFESDGDGGAVLSWYDDRNNDMINEVYYARITGSGVLTTAANGVLVTGDTGQQQYYPQICVDNQNSRSYVFFRTTNPDQTLSGLKVQALSFGGERLWGDNAHELNGLSNLFANSLYAYMSGTTARFVYSLGTAPNSDTSLNLRVWSYQDVGPGLWTTRPLATTNTAKLHYDFATHPDGWMIGTWEEGMSGYDIYANRMNTDGSLGQSYLPPVNLQGQFVAPNTILLTWASPQTALMPLAYKIYVNGALAETIGSGETSYALNNMQPGTYSIYLTALYEGNMESVASNLVLIEVVSNDDAVAPSLAANLRISPNPVHGLARLSFDSTKAGRANIRIFNLRGQLLFTKDIELDGSLSQEAELDLGGLATGLYYLQLSREGNTLSKRIVIQR